MRTVTAGGFVGTLRSLRKMYSHAIDKYPAEPANFIDLGKLCLKENRLDTGLKVAQNGAALHPSSASLFEVKGEIESKEGLHAKAVQSYQKAYQLEPKSPEALLGLAIAQINLLQNQEAVANFEKGIKLYPRHARFHAEYGKALLLPWAGGEIPTATVKAEQLLKKALQLDNSISMAHFELGRLQVKEKRSEEALPHLQMAAKLDPKKAETHFLLGRACRDLGRAAEAESEMKLFQQLESSAKGVGGSKQ
jgi:protein O-GlcNAc transferase